MMTHPAYQADSYIYDFPGYPAEHIAAIIQSAYRAVHTHADYAHLPPPAKHSVTCLLVRYTLAGRDITQKLALRGSIDAIVWAYPR